MTKKQPTILITGGTGFVGSHMVTLLRQQEPDARLVVTSHRPRPDKDGVRTYALDLTDSQAVFDLLQETRPDQIYHLASIAAVGASFTDPAGVLRNNFHLTLNLLEGLRQYLPQTKLLLISTADLYDHTSSSPIDEKRALAPSNPYAASKASQDFLGQTYAQSFKLPIVIARPFNHIGPGQKNGFVVADFASQVAKIDCSGQPGIIEVGNLDSSRDFTDVRDMVRAYHLLMTDGGVGEIYNIGTGTATSIRDILDKMIALASVPIEVVVDKSKLRPVDVPIIQANPAKIKQLGWQPRIPLDQTLADIFASWRDIISTHKVAKG